MSSSGVYKNIKKQPYKTLRSRHKKKRDAISDVSLSGKRDSNSRPRPWQGRALPTELFPQNRSGFALFLAAARKRKQVFSSLTLHKNSAVSKNGTAKIRQKNESPNFFSFFACRDSFFGLMLVSMGAEKFAENGKKR